MREHPGKLGRSSLDGLQGELSRRLANDTPGIMRMLTTGQVPGLDVAKVKKDAQSAAITKQIAALSASFRLSGPRAGRAVRAVRAASAAPQPLLMSYRFRQEYSDPAEGTPEG